MKETARTYQIYPDIPEKALRKSDLNFVPFLLKKG